MKKKCKENKCKKYCDQTQVRTGFSHILHKVVLHNTLLHMRKTCVLHMTFTHYNPWYTVNIISLIDYALTAQL